MNGRYSRSRRMEVLRNNDFTGGLAAWARDSGGGNDEQLARVLRNMRRIRDAELTEKQEEILHLYYDLGMSVPVIAREKGLHKSSVSRTLARGKERLKRYLQYSS